MATSSDSPTLYHLYRELKKNFEGTQPISPLAVAAGIVRSMTPIEVEQAALQRQEFDMENQSVVTHVLKIVAEVLERADGS